MSKIITGVWKQEEIKNASELFLKYKMPIPDMARIINRSAIDIKKKLIELKIIDDDNPILTLINERMKIENVEPLDLLCKILSDLENRIKNLEK